MRFILFVMKDLNLRYVFEVMWRDRSVTVSADRLGLTQAAGPSPTPSSPTSRDR